MWWQNIKRLFEVMSIWYVDTECPHERNGRLRPVNQYVWGKVRG
jgi:hypothetical protein